MQARRSLATFAFVVVTAVGLASCGSVHGVLNGRDLTCEEMPQDLCIRVAMVALADPNVGPAMSSAVTTLTVKSAHCNTDDEATATQCWIVEGNDAKEGFGTRVYQNPDGTLASPK